MPLAIRAWFRLACPRKPPPIHHSKPAAHSLYYYKGAVRIGGRRWSERGLILRRRAFDLGRVLLGVAVSLALLWLAARGLEWDGVMGSLGAVSPALALGVAPDNADRARRNRS